ncbi:MAG: RNA polymerase sigma factor [Opitutaceae bacterium]|nr:RNA polymerase sigma factor [Cytophagales bacterium]
MIESELISKVRKGDALAQKQLYQLLAPTLFATCLRYTKSRYEAEDFLQDSFVKIFQNINTFRSDGPIAAWARRITVNTVIEEFKKRDLLRESHDLQTHGNHLADNSVNVLSDLSCQDLRNLINKLPNGKKVVFNLFVLDGYNHKEIAELLNITEGTSKSQLAKAKELLAEMHRTQNENARQITRKY